jgi:cell division inhibitor SepF
MGAFLGLVAQDDPERGDYHYPDDYADAYPEEYAGGDYEAPYPADYAPRSGRDDARRSTPSAEPVVQGALAVQMYPKTRRASDTGGSARPLTVKLTGFAEARVIGERYRDGSSVFLDMTDLSDSDARRVVDFAAGLAFALHGSIDKVTARVFMLLPPHVDMSAEDRRAFAAGGWG